MTPNRLLSGRVVTSFTGKASHEFVSCASPDEVSHVEEINTHYTPIFTEHAVPCSSSVRALAGLLLQLKFKTCKSDNTQDTNVGINFVNAKSLRYCI